MGNEPSLGAVAENFAKAHTILITEDYGKVCMQTLSASLTNVCQLLKADTQAAKLEMRVALTFIDLSHQDVLMPWLIAEACSGKNSMEVDISQRGGLMSKIVCAVQRPEVKTRSLEVQPLAFGIAAVCFGGHCS